MKSFTFETNLNSYLLKTNFKILLILVIITIGFSSCNAVKYVPENEHLITANTIFVNDKKNVKSEVTDYIVQRPNEKVLGIPLQLYLYNSADENFETDFDQWKKDYPKKYNFITSVFSEKQTRGVRNFKYNANKNLLKKIKTIKASCHMWGHAPNLTHS